MSTWAEKDKAEEARIRWLIEHESLWKRSKRLSYWTSRKAWMRIVTKMKEAGLYSLKTSPVDCAIDKKVEMARRILQSAQPVE